MPSSFQYFFVYNNPETEAQRSYAHAALNNKIFPNPWVSNLNSVARNCAELRGIARSLQGSQLRTRKIQIALKPLPNPPEEKKHTFTR